MYVTECWDLKNQHENKLSLEKLKMFCLKGLKMKH